MSEIEVGYHPKIRASERAKISSSLMVCELVRNDWKGINLHESFKVLMLNRANRVLGIYELSKGGIAGTVIDVRLIFATALKALACGIIIIHNHPSGNTRPSDADISITRKIQEAGKFLDIQLIDSMIITEDGYISFADEGVL